MKTSPGTWSTRSTRTIASRWTQLLRPIRMQPFASNSSGIASRSLRVPDADRDPALPPAGLALRAMGRMAEYLAEREKCLPSKLHEEWTHRHLGAIEPEEMPTATSRPLPRPRRDEPEARAVGGRFRPDLIVACGIAPLRGRAGLHGGGQGPGAQRIVGLPEHTPRHAYRSGRLCRYARQPLSPDRSGRHGGLVCRGAGRLGPGSPELPSRLPRLPAPGSR